MALSFYNNAGFNVSIGQSISRAMLGERTKAYGVQSTTYETQTIPVLIKRLLIYLSADKASKVLSLPVLIRRLPRMSPTLKCTETPADTLLVKKDRRVRGKLLGLVAMRGKGLPRMRGKLLSSITVLIKRLLNVPSADKAIRLVIYLSADKAMAVLAETSPVLIRRRRSL